MSKNNKEVTRLWHDMNKIRHAVSTMSCLIVSCSCPIVSYLYNMTRRGEPGFELGRREIKESKFVNLRYDDIDNQRRK
jgi:hypothetical protein